jgi:hypothetical protein
VLRWAADMAVGWKECTNKLSVGSEAPRERGFFFGAGAEGLAIQAREAIFGRHKVPPPRSGSQIFRGGTREDARGCICRALLGWTAGAACPHVSIADVGTRTGVSAPPDLLPKSCQAPFIVRFLVSC